MTSGGWIWFVAFVILLFVCIEYAAKDEPIEPFDPDLLEDE